MVFGGVEAGVLIVGLGLGLGLGLGFGLEVCGVVFTGVLGLGGGVVFVAVFFVLDVEDLFAPDASPFEPDADCEEPDVPCLEADVPPGVGGGTAPGFDVVGAVERASGSS